MCASSFPIHVHYHEAKVFEAHDRVCEASALHCKGRQARLVQNEMQQDLGHRLQRLQ